MKLKPFCAVIFDCDGVLVDSEMLGLRSLQCALSENGVKLSLDDLTRFSGRSHSETLSELERQSGVPLWQRGVAQRMDEIYMQIVQAEGLGRCAGVTHLLSWLAVREIPFTLASSGPRKKVRFSLAAAHLDTFFPRFVCGDDVTHAKPEPDVYLAAAALIGAEPARCLAIEDAPNGVRAARSAGMQVAAVTTGFAPEMLAEADLVVNSLTQLTGYFADPLVVAL
jgi:beta-phosphoglucomutase-like phosphatase (HAD superfamily)